MDSTLLLTTTLCSLRPKETFRLLTDLIRMLSRHRRKAVNKILYVIDTLLGNQKAHRDLNAFISAAGKRPSFEQEIRESMERYDNSLFLHR